MKINVEEINSFLDGNSEFAVEYRDFCCVDVEEGETAHIEASFDAVTDALAAKQKELGLYIEDGILHVDTANLQALRDISEKIDEQYEHKEEGEEDLWVTYKLGGDDYVDYCGSYVLMGLDAIEAYLKFKAGA